MNIKKKPIAESSEPVLAPGTDGTFDDSGIGTGCLTTSEDSVRLYYMGWNLSVRAAWRNSIGFAYARTPLDGFRRYSQGPILDRSPEDPYTLTYPYVLRRSSQDWLMWYGSNLTPNISNKAIQHVIKVARSRDGIHWDRSSDVAIGFARPNEHIILRPSVLEIGDLFLMCFTTRGDNYQIGAAWSRDLQHWTRIDDAMGLRPSNSDWESRMTCYPASFLHREQLWLVYNGDGYGRTGFGLSVWDTDIPDFR